MGHHFANFSFTVNFHPFGGFAVVNAAVEEYKAVQPRADFNKLKVELREKAQGFCEVLPEVLLFGDDARAVEAYFVNNW